MESNWTIVNGCTVRKDEWYHRGSDRLAASVDGKVDILTYKGFPNPNYGDRKYRIKASCMHEARKERDRLFWMDCSVYLTGDHESVLRKASDRGYYFINNGMNCAQECNDQCLEYFDVTRDEAEGIRMCSSGFFALDLNNPTCAKLLDEWLESCAHGIWSGSREHARQSRDPRFLHHRQDQSALSLLIYKHGLFMDQLGDEIAYYPDNKKNWIIHGCI